jgi:protein KTI12
VKIISDDVVGVDRASYDGPCRSYFPRALPTETFRDTDSLQEKTARAALFTAMTRHIARDTILIVDSVNYIKGFRYQMYCKAREAGVRVATVGNVFPVFITGTPRVLTQMRKVGICPSYA